MPVPMIEEKVRKRTEIKPKNTYGHHKLERILIYTDWAMIFLNHVE